MSASLVRMVKSCFYAHTPVLLEGEPGVGKTSFAHWLAREINGIAIVVCLSHKEATEVHGIPIVSRQVMKIDGREITCVVQAPPRYAQDALATNKPVVLLLDELTCLPPMTQAPALAIISENIVAELQLPRERVAVMAAANPAALAAGGWQLPPPMANRLVRLQFKIDSVEWSEAFPTYWDMPPQFSRWGYELNATDWGQKRALIAAYIRQAPDQLLIVPKDATGRSGPWPSPRTWDYVSRQLVTADREGLREDEIYAITAGTIGDAAAAQFKAWHENMDMGDPRELVDNPESFKLPAKNRSDKLYYLLMGMCAEIAFRVAQSREPGASKKSKDLALTSWNTGWRVIEKALKAGGARDLGAIAANYLAQPSRFPAGAKPPPEVDGIVPIVRAAGLDWGSQGRSLVKGS